MAQRTEQLSGLMVKTLGTRNQHPETALSSCLCVAFSTHGYSLVQKKTYRKKREQRNVTKFYVPSAPLNSSQSKPRQFSSISHVRFTLLVAQSLTGIHDQRSPL